jgi:peptide/nickel transport system substrate-binding protein
MTNTNSQNLFRALILLTLFSLLFSTIGGTSKVFASNSGTSLLGTTTRHGGWVDEIVMSVVNESFAVAGIQNSIIDIFAGKLSSATDVAAVMASGLPYAESMGVYYDITLNPSGPIFSGTGKLNPFADAKIREALNWLIGRNYINTSIYGGIGIPKFLPITSDGPDYARYVDTVRAVETKYGYDFLKAKQIITTEMFALGATQNASNKWIYNGQPVTLIFIIRNDGDGTRKLYGDYIADQLQSIGFTVNRQYKTAAEASPFWLGSDPAAGLWHLYTGGWRDDGISRDEGFSFQEYYTQNSQGYGSVPLWQAYNPPAPYLAAADELAQHTYTSMEERDSLFEYQLNATLPVSYRVWVIAARSLTPWRSGLTVSYDTVAGVDVNKLWPHTLRYTASEGGTVKWANADLLHDPINPVAGSAWLYDTQWQLATGDASMLPNPFTGLPQAQRLNHADIYVQNGLPVTGSSDWVNLSFVTGNDVPSEAWIDWDPSAAKWKTVGEVYPGGLTAKCKVVVTYPTGMYSNITWHDGSPLSEADFIMPWIEKFATGTPNSDIYDAALEANLTNFKTTFKGIKFVSADPLVIEYYTDNWQLDAEKIVPETWPTYTHGSLPWHVLAVSNIAAAADELAFSSDAATAKNIPWMNYFDNTSQTILLNTLIQAKNGQTVPYPNVLGTYITPTDAATRYTNLETWNTNHGHLWVGSGPYFLDTVNYSGKTLKLKANTTYIDLADKWIGLTEPKLGEVNVNGPASINAGAVATFDVAVNYQGSPYPSTEIEKVTYLLADDNGNIIGTGDATNTGEGQYQVILGAGLTSKLATGDGYFESQVVAKQTSMPFYDFHKFSSISTAPQPFGKSAPLRWSLLPVSTSVVLQWNTSVGAASYQYCLDTKNNDICDTVWKNAGTATNITASGLLAGKIYYWQVRAINASGQTLANAAGGWWSFRVPLKKTLYADKLKDGWILESARGSGKGGLVNTTADLILGDNASNKQYRSVLSFLTSSLPDNAVITNVTLKVKRNAIIGGGNPLTAFQGILTDIKTGFLGTSAILQVSDFQASASNRTSLVTKATLTGGWYSLDLKTGSIYINRLADNGGLTQIRLRFKLATDGNGLANSLSLFSADAGTTSSPQLVIEYYVP